jgi:anti-anti-sigma regulatory factor
MRAPFDLPADLRIYSAIETRDAMLAWVAEEASAGHDYLQISARDVEEVDGSGLQLLAALSNMETPWHLVETSEPFAQACRHMGFAYWLDKRYLKTQAGDSAS